MIKIKLHANWAGDNQDSVRTFMNYLCTKKVNYTWEDLEIVDAESDDYDYFIIFNFPLHDDFDFKKAIVFQSEHDANVRYFNDLDEKYNFNFVEENKDKFFKVFDMKNNFCVDGAWKIWMPYGRLLRSNFSKEKHMSALISGANWFELHKMRLNFLLNYLYVLNNFDHYGKGDFTEHPKYKGYVDYCEDAYMNYMYTFNCEAYEQENYFTEKIRDPIFCECLPFYYGCPNIEDFINPKAFIKIDISDPEKAVSEVIDAIKNEEWKKRYPIIKKEKMRLMKDLNPLNVIWHIIHKEELRLFKDLPKSDKNEGSE